MTLLLAPNKASKNDPAESIASEWFRDAAGKLTLAFVGMVILHILYVFFHWGGDEYKSIISNVATIFVYLVTCLYTWRTSTHRSMTVRSRRAWRLISLANGAYLVGSILWIYFENYLGTQPFPSLADIGFLAYFPFMMAGLMLLVEPMRSTEERLGFVLDVALIMIGCSLVVWYFLLQPLIDQAEGFTPTTVLSVAYPVGDLVMLFGIAAILLRRRAVASATPVTLVLAGVVATFAADFFFGYQSLNGTYESGNWVDALWTLACLPIVLGAHYRYLLADHEILYSSQQAQRRLFLGLPYLAVVAGFAILFLVEFGETVFHGFDLIVASVLTALILLRQFMFLRENIRTKNAVSDLQERIQGIYSATSDGIAISDFDGHIIDVNDAFARLLGYDRTELVSGFSILDFTTGSDRDATIAVNRQVLTTQAAVEYEKTYVRRDGSKFIASVNVFPIRSQKGIPSAIAASIRDITERKLSETLLREAEERWQLALRVNRDGVWDWDLRHNKFYFSPRWREMFGYGPDEPVPFSISHYDSVFHPDDRHLAREIRLDLSDGESPYIDVEFRHMCKDGSFRWIRCRAEAVIDKQTGRLDRVIGLNTDITERKRHEIESRAVAKILRGVSETSNLEELLASVHDAIDSVIFAKNFFVALHDDTTDLFKMQFFVDEHDRTPASDNLEGTRSHYVFRTGQPLLLDDEKTATLESEGRFRLVGTQPNYWLGVPLRTPNNVIGVLVVQSYDAEHSYTDEDLQFLINISGPVALAIERKRAEIRMRLLSTALDNAANGVVVTDQSGSIEWVNHAFTTLTGYSAMEVRGKNPGILQSGKHPKSFYADLWQTIRAGKVWNGEITNRRKNGEEYDEEMTITPVFDEASGTRHYIAIKNDISDRKLAEEQVRIFNEKLQRSNRELQEFAYIASHDLQEPLRKVQTFADLLGSKYAANLDETGRDYLDRMKNAAQRMQNLIQDLLSFSRVTTKAQPFTKVDLGQTARDVVSDLEVKIDETGGVIEIEDLPVVDADPLQMRQLLQNLIGNALKFHREGVAPLVRVSAEPIDRGSERKYRLVIEDNGIGFDEKYLDRIFIVFQRLHGRTEFEGSGIGLAVCRKIVERHLGTITATSVPGQGSKFIVTLPADQPSSEVS